MVVSLCDQCCDLLIFQSLNYTKLAKVESTENQISTYIFEMSNRLGIDDEKYWNDSKIKGFGFGEDTESIEEVEDCIFKDDDLAN